MPKNPHRKNDNPGPEVGTGVPGVAACFELGDGVKINIQAYVYDGKLMIDTASNAPMKLEAYDDPREGDRCADARHDIVLIRK
jgi:hypothetical protein